MSALINLPCPADESFLGHFFRGEAGADHKLNALFAHRFEATFLRRTLGQLPTDVLPYHEKLFRKFLAYADEQKFDMGWTLSLHFLKWAQATEVLPSLHGTAESILTRAAYRWINASHRDLDTQWIILPIWPSHERNCLVGQKSQHPTQLPRLFKARGRDFPDDLAYRLSNRFPPSNCTWIYV